MKFTNARGYTAFVSVRNDERVIYNVVDEKGEHIQRNACVSAKFFDQNWTTAR